MQHSWDNLKEGPPKPSLVVKIIASVLWLLVFIMITWACIRWFPRSEPIEIQNPEAVALMIMFHALLPR